MNEKELNLDVGPDGVIRSIYSDDLNKVAEGVGEVVRVCRLSNVEWEDHGEGLRGWVVRAAHDTELAIRDVGSAEPVFVVSRDPQLRLAIFTSREVAVAVEVSHYEELMPPKEKR